jgi:tetratricopeptide (TPR) repeat protein
LKFVIRVGISPVSVHSSPASQPSSSQVPSAQERLDSWKEIAAYLRRDERTVRRWEKSEGLPVHRHPHCKQSSVYAYRVELDAWWNNGHERLAAMAAESPATRPRPRRALQWALGGVAVIAIGAAVVWLASRPQQAATPPNAASSDAVAVWPLRNVSGKAELDYLSLAAADVIANRLSYGSVRVVPPEWVPGEFLGPSADFATAAQRLRVNLLVSGTYEEIPGRLRVHLQLMRMPGPTLVWQQTIDTNPQGIVSLGDLVAEQALPNVRLPETLSQKEAEANQATAEHYLRGVDAQAREDLTAGVEALQSALKKSPGLGPAEARLAFAFLGSSYSVASNRKQEEEAILLLRSAVAKNAASPRLLSLAGLFLVEVGRLDEATEMLRRAVAINPRHAESHLWLSQAYRYGGALEESLREAELALRLDPEMREMSTLNAYLYAGRYEEFLRSMPQRAMSARSVFYRGMAHLYQGELARAESEFAKSARVQPGQLHGRYGEAFRLGIRGEREEGLRLLRQLDGRLHADGEMRYKMAQAAAVLQDKPTALRLLQQAVEADFYCHSCFVRDPLLASLRGDSGFDSLLAIAQRKQEAFHKRFLP